MATSGDARSRAEGGPARFGSVGTGGLVHSTFHPARLLYVFLFLLGSSIVVSVVFAIATVGPSGIPTLNRIRSLYVVRFALGHPQVSIPTGLLLMLIAVYGGIIHHRRQPTVAFTPPVIPPAPEESSDEEWTPPHDIAVLPLPPHASGLVGRDAERAWLRERLLAGTSTGVWAFAGLGGIGKTCLVAALLPELLPHFSGGVGVIRANEVADPYVIIRQLVEMFVPNGPAMMEKEATTRTALLRKLQAALTKLHAAGRRVLVAIDNVEPDLIPRLKPVVDVLHAGHASLVITARQELPRTLVNDSLEINLLADAAAAELFGRLVFSSGHEPTQSEREDIATICRLAGNHSQALVLAAADLKQRPIETLASYRQHLEAAPDAVLNLYERLGGDTPGGVRLTFATSYNHLGAYDPSLDRAAIQRLFTALGTLAGPSCGISVVLALGGAQGQSAAETQRQLDALLLSKLVRKSAEADPAAEPRIEMHPLVQQYARELLAAQPTEADEAYREALAAHYAGWTRGRPEQTLRPDDANLVAALEWAAGHTPRADSTLAELCDNLQEYWQRRLQSEQARRWIPPALEAMERLGPAWRQREGHLAHSLARECYRSLGATSETIGHYERSLGIFREIGDRSGQALALHSLGIVYMGNDQERSRRYLTESLDIRREIGDQPGEAQSLSSLGILMQESEPDAAREYLGQSLAIRERLGLERDVAITLRAQGTLERNAGDLAAAEQYYTRSLQICQRLGYVQDAAFVLQYLGAVERQRHNLNVAKDYYLESLDMLKEIAEAKYKVHSLYGLGFVELDLGALEEAREYFQQSLLTCEQAVDRRSEGITYRGLGDLARREGHLDEAEQRYRKALELAEHLADHRLIAAACHALGLLQLESRREVGGEGCELLARAESAYAQVRQRAEEQRVRADRERLGCLPGSL